MNLKGQPATVGKHCGSNVYTIDPETVAFYQDALDDRHPVAALGRHRRGLHAARAAADDHYVERGFGPPPRAKAPFPAGLGMLDARDGMAGLHVADAGLIAGDTDADVFSRLKRRKHADAG